MRYGIKPWEWGKLYAFQEDKIFKAYDADVKFQASLAGAKLR